MAPSQQRNVTGKVSMLWAYVYLKELVIGNKVTSGFSIYVLIL